MTPLHWQILLHYYASPEPYARDNPRHANSVAVKEYTASLINNELLRADEVSVNTFHTTDRGNALVDHIRHLPLPEKVWIMPSFPSQNGKTP